MRSRNHTFSIPGPVWEAFRLNRASGRVFGNYKSDGAVIVGLILYAIGFPKAHHFTGQLAKLPLEYQDIIHEYILHCTKEGIEIASLLPKPAKLKGLLALALQWKEAQKD